MAQEKALVISDAEVLDGSLLKAALDRSGASLETASVVTSSSVPKLTQGAYSAIVSLSQSSSHHSVAVLGQLCSALRPGGKLLVEEPKVYLEHETYLAYHYDYLQPCMHRS